MDIETVRTETIKPSSQTPHHLRSFRLSILDQSLPVTYTRILLFFTPTENDQKPATVAAERSELLRAALSQTLTSFYPFAGRLKDNLEIDCNDEGVEFVETRVGCSISAIMEKPDPEWLIQLVPADRVLSREAVVTVPLLRLKVNSFECGGVAIGLSLTHKIADAATISTFLNCWAANMPESPFDSPMLPQFVPPTLFPQSDSLSSLPAVPAQPPLPQKIAERRLLFPGPRISALRSQSSTPAVPNPTRVEAVLALIWKCAMRAARSGSSHLKRSGLLQAVNVRRRLDPPLPENSSGNLSWVYPVKCSTDPVSDPELQNLVGLIRKGIEEFSEGCDVRMRSEGLNQYFEEFVVMSSDKEMDMYVTTSWCRFPFNGVDFGWGKPSWVCVPNVRVKNVILLMDARDEYEDGIEVCLCLAEEEMACFERSRELLEFASFSPC